ncbi:MAG: hypothetical protein KatS3mg076_0863 [Candidatus Binatia bacterium]|nr:MAG: hypothetical protein KatS3mg076_0863 [Candidatus Binatia bacterium]
MAVFANGTGGHRRCRTDGSFHAPGRDGARSSGGVRPSYAARHCKRGAHVRTGAPSDVSEGHALSWPCSSEGHALSWPCSRMVPAVIDDAGPTVLPAPPDATERGDREKIPGHPNFDQKIQWNRRARSRPWCSSMVRHASLQTRRTRSYRRPFGRIGGPRFVVAMFPPGCSYVARVIQTRAQFVPPPSDVSEGHACRGLFGCRERRSSDAKRATWIPTSPDATERIPPAGPGMARIGGPRSVVAVFANGTGGHRRCPTDGSPHAPGRDGARSSGGAFAKIVESATAHATDGRESPSPPDARARIPVTETGPRCRRRSRGRRR